MARRLIAASTLLALSVGWDEALAENDPRCNTRALKFGQPLLTTELSGSLNGVVGSSSRGGVNYFRTRVVPSNPRTYSQDVVRAILSGVAAAWRNTLTSVQRAAWAAIAGPSESGINRYTAANTVIMQGGTARQDTAPASKDLAWLAIPTAPQFKIAKTDATAYLNAAGSTFGAVGEKINFYLQSKVQPPSRNFPIGNMEFAGSITLGSTAIPTLDITAFLAAHTDYVAGQVANMAVIKFKTTGEVSTRITNPVTITAH